MASLKIKYRQSSIEGKAGTLFYQVIHKRISKADKLRIQNLS